MSSHFVIALDGAHLRFYARGTDEADRFQAALEADSASTASTTTSSDERLPVQEDEERRRARDLAAQIETFLAARSDATWDFAAGPSWNQAVVRMLSPSVQGRLKRLIAKNLPASFFEDAKSSPVEGGIFSTALSGKYSKS